jgi:chromosome segregation ATPase
MNELFFEFLKVSLGIAVGGAFSTPFKVLRAYNSTQLSIGNLEQKLENLGSLLQHWERGFVEAKIRSERLEQMIESMDRRLVRAETLLESLEESRRIPD